MVCYARGGREATLTEGTSYIIATVDSAVEMLSRVINLCWKLRSLTCITYRLQIILTFESLLAVRAPVLSPVTLLVHVPLDACEAIITKVAGFAYVIRTIMAFVLLVVLKVFGVKVSIITVIAFPHVVHGKHMLPCSVPVDELSVACTAFVHCKVGLRRLG